MAIIALKAWYLEQYEPIKEVIKRPHDLRLSRNSLLKSGLRADFLDDRQDVKESVWFGRYLEGETVEFYIEGSGGYAISNIDLISQEIYFTKQEIAAWLDPVIFLSHQTEYPAASEALRTALGEAIEILNQRSRLPLILEEAQRPTDAPMRLSSTQLRKIRKSLVFVADGTPVARLQKENQSGLLPSPNICVEIGYALQSKRYGQILLARMERPDWIGQFPFDLPHHQHLGFKTASELSKTLPPVLETLLQRFNYL
ncbi:MAG: hypothetical protein AB4426_03765 [Xenococcaceae cyanobacterium]